MLRFGHPLCAVESVDVRQQALEGFRVKGKPERPVLLTGYDAKRCARRIYNEWDPSIEKVEWEVPASLQMRFDAGIAFEAAVFGEIKPARLVKAVLDLTTNRGLESDPGIEPHLQTRRDFPLDLLD